MGIISAQNIGHPFLWMHKDTKIPTFASPKKKLAALIR